MQLSCLQHLYSHGEGNIGYWSDLQHHYSGQMEHYKCVCVYVCVCVRARVHTRVLEVEYNL